MATGASKAMFSSMLTYYIENVNMYLQDDEIKLLFISQSGVLTTLLRTMGVVIGHVFTMPIWHKLQG